MCMGKGRGKQKERSHREWTHLGVAWRTPSMLLHVHRGEGVEGEEKVGEVARAPPVRPSGIVALHLGNKGEPRTSPDWLGGRCGRCPVISAGQLGDFCHQTMGQAREELA